MLLATRFSACCRVNGRAVNAMGYDSWLLGGFKPLWELRLALNKAGYSTSDRCERGPNQPRTLRSRRRGLEGSCLGESAG